MIRVILVSVGDGLTSALAACSSDPPGLKACNYVRDEYLDLDAFWAITLSL